MSQCWCPIGNMLLLVVATVTIMAYLSLAFVSVERQHRHHGVRIAGPSSQLRSATTTSADNGNFVTKQSALQPLSPLPSWNDYFQALVEYQNQFGHTRVPKRHTDTVSVNELPSPDSKHSQLNTVDTTIQLGSWVSRQRQRKDRLSAGQISQLDSIHFCWNAQDDKKRKVNHQWWNRFHDIQKVRNRALEAVIASSPQLPPLEESLSASQLAWLRRQRNDYVDHYQLNYTASCKLDDGQLQALSQLDPEWYKTPRERQWLVQFHALQEYQKENGE